MKSCQATPSMKGLLIATCKTASSQCACTCCDQGRRQKPDSASTGSLLSGSAIIIGVTVALGAASVRKIGLPNGWNASSRLLTCIRSRVNCPGWACPMLSRIENPSKTIADCVTRSAYIIGGIERAFVQ